MLGLAGRIGTAACSRLAEVCLLWAKWISDTHTWRTNQTRRRTEERDHRCAAVSTIVESRGKVGSARCLEVGRSKVCHLMQAPGLRDSIAQSVLGDYAILVADWGICTLTSR